MKLKIYTQLSCANIRSRLKKKSIKAKKDLLEAKELNEDKEEDVKELVQQTGDDYENLRLIMQAKYDETIKK